MARLHSQVLLIGKKTERENTSIDSWVSLLQVSCFQMIVRLSKTRLVFSLPGKCCAQLCLRCPIYSLILSTDVYKFGMVRGGKTGAANDLTGTLTTDLTVTETHIKVKNYFTSGISNWCSRLPGPRRTFEAAWLSRSSN